MGAQMSKEDLGRVDVALVGRRLADNENLGLGYLQAAVARAGFCSRRHTLNNFAELDRIAGSIMASQTPLVGLSLPDGGSAVLPLTLGELLHRRGYPGHITCGGAFATLSRDWLLKRYGWLDSVVRFAGEAPLIQLCSALRSDSDVQIHHVAGLTTRAGDGLPAPLLDALPTKLTPTRSARAQPTILGHAAAHVLATRGCLGRCSYCGPAALQKQEWSEGRRAGLTSKRLRLAGVGGVSRRPIADLCEELATLYHERAVRYFYFVDEHLLPHDEQHALAFLAAWKDELQRRKVGPIGIGTMLRADRMTDELVRAFADVGLIRAFVGLEFASDDEARGYARKTSVAHALRLLRTFDEARVATVSNVMLVHPESTHETLQQGIEQLQEIPSGVFETVRMMAYHGTKLADRLQREGRLRGNPLRYSYTFDDPVVERFGQIFSRLRGEAFYDHSIAYRTHDVFLALALQRRLGATADLGPLTRRIELVRRGVNALYIKSLRTALGLAHAGAGALQATELIVQARASSRALIEQLQLCEQKLLPHDAPDHARLFSPMRAAASAAFVLGVATTATACNSSVTVAGPSTDSTSTSTSSASSSSTAPGTISTAPASCSEQEVENQKQQVRAIVGTEQPCFNGYLNYEDGLHAQTEFSSGFGIGNPIPTLCYSAENQAAKDAMEEAIAKALEGKLFPCLGTDFSSGYIPIEGGAGKQADTMTSMIMEACPDIVDHLGQVAISLDASGAVVAVTADPGSKVPPEALQCAETALKGLTFPCLAGYQICPEYIVGE